MLPRELNDKKSTCQYKICGFDPWLGKISWRRRWEPTAAFLPGKSSGQRSLAGYSPYGRKVEHNWITQYTRAHTHTHTHM